MLYQPKLFKGSFNRYYVIARPVDVLVLSGIAKAENLYGCADSFVRGLDASDSDWRSLLCAFSDIELRHTRKPYSELIAALLHSGRIRAYRVPSSDELRKLSSCTLTDKNSGFRYLFLPGNACLLVKTDYQKSFRSLKDSESFLGSTQLTDEQVATLVAFLNRDIPLNLGPRKRLAHALVEGSLIVGVAPAGTMLNQPYKPPNY